MDKVITEKKGIWILLVIATVIVFIGLVWIIARYLPLSFTSAPGSSPTASIERRLADCTSPVAYWEEHAELYPAKLVISGQEYAASELKQVLEGQKGDLASRLQAQLTAAYLNISSGADQSYIETTIFEAYSWLVGHPAGSEVSADEESVGLRLYNLLEAYNQGLTGVDPCMPITSPIIGEASEEPTVTVTFTASPTTKPAPSETELPTNPPSTLPIPTVSVPTHTATPTREPTRHVPATPTDTLVPPTNTIEPTHPTKTPPPPTRTYTPPPPPTTPTFPPIPAPTQ